MEKRLIPLCRGLRCGSFGRGFVGNGCLWWPETGSESDGLSLLVSGLHCFSSPETMLVVAGVKGAGDEGS